MNLQDYFNRLADAEWELNAAWKAQCNFTKKFYPHSKDRHFSIFDREKLDGMRERIQAAKIERFRAFKAAVEAFQALPDEQRREATKSESPLVRRVAKESLDPHCLQTEIKGIYIPTGVYLAMREQGVNIQDAIETMINQYQKRMIQK